MSGSYTYPGIYIREIPSGVHTIAGVPTSNTAFIDYFPRGPRDEAVRITGFGDFTRRFGGLDPLSEASYAIQQFFLNGGAIAWVVRVAAGTPQASGADLLGGSPADVTLHVAAAEDGEWGDNLQVAALSAGSADRFNLFVREVVRDGTTIKSVVRDEAFLNLSMVVGDPRYAPDVIHAGSAMIQLTDKGLGQLPVLSAPTPRGGVPDAAWTDLHDGANGSPPGAKEIIGDDLQMTGMYALNRIAPDIFNLMCIPRAANLDDTQYGEVISNATAYCEDRRAFLLVDIPETVTTEAQMRGFMTQHDTLRHRNAAIYFPRLLIPDALKEGRSRNVGTSGTLAGVYARTDATTGVWKSPAGIEATLRNADLAVKLTDAENGSLNPIGVNVLRNFPVFGNTSWGARTLFGADQQASEWKYVAVRRTALYIEESLFQGLKWVVFEPNDERLWSQIRLNVTGFMHNLFRQGAFQGTTPDEAYLVKCDSDTTTQTDIDRGIVNILVGFRPLKPAEFVVIQIQQLAGQAQS